MRRAFLAMEGAAAEAVAAVFDQHRLADSFAVHLSPLRFCRFIGILSI
jgi:hypothetical protein